MKLRNWTLAALPCVLLIFCFSLTALADPPGRVGRLNYLSGSVSFRPGELDDWAPAVINLPLKTGDHLWTDTNSQAEIHVGSTAVRLAPETAFTFLNLDDHATQIRLTEGAVNLRVRQLADSDVFEIDTPNSAVSLLRPGVYRVTVDAQGNTTVTDRSGESEVTAMGSAFALHPRESASISGADSPTYDVQTALSPDSWDDWCAARDRREDQAVSVRYVPREMVGYEDLDVYGTWRTDPEYGAVWIPTAVPAGWAPYRYGHWMWVEPWGWTWVDDMPWGFAPFHYGRWAHGGGGWVWVPGRVVARPVYAPALVAFVGGNNWHVSLSIGNGVAWFPLGPREAYVPAYHASPTYVRNVNITHVNVTNVNVTNVNVVNTTYVNRTVPGAVTAVPQEAFVRAQPVSKAAVAVPPQAIASAPVSGMTAAVAPRQESVTGRAGVAAPAAHPPAQAMSRTVVARNTPPPPPVSFATRQSALAANPGQPLDSAAETRLRQNAPAAPVLVKPAIPKGQPAGTPGGMHPAREGVSATHPMTTPAPSAPAAASAPIPVPAPTSAPAPKINPGTGNVSGAPGQPTPSPNDRPNRAPIPSTPRVNPPQPPSPIQAEPKPQPKTQPVEPKPQPKVVPPPAPTAAPAPRENDRPNKTAPESRPAPSEVRPPVKPSQPAQNPPPNPGNRPEGNRQDRGVRPEQQPPAAAPRGEPGKEVHPAAKPEQHDEKGKPKASDKKDEERKPPR